MWKNYERRHTISANLWKTSSSNAFQTTLNGGISAVDTSVILTSVTGLSTTGGVLCLDRTDSAGTATPTKREYISYTGITTNTLTGVTRGVAGSTAQSHNSGSIVEETFTTTHWLDLLTAIQNVLTSAGILDVTKVVDLTTAQALTNKTLTAPVITSPTLTVGSDAQGDIYYRSASGFTRLGAGTSGQFLKTLGASANPAWADVSVSSDGWTSSSDTWTYVSATTFKISGADRTTTFTPGTKLKLTQTTAKYFYVESSTFSTDTTITVNAGTDYSLANAAITSPSYSYQTNPQGHPTWFNYTTTWGGFSANPTNVVSKFMMSGRSVTFEVSANNAGTSNSTALTITVPIAPASQNFFATTIGYDNGAYVTTPGRALTSAGSTTVSLYKDYAATNWTASGGKVSSTAFTYDI